MVQQDVIEKLDYPAVEEALKGAYRRTLGTRERLSIVWCEVPHGQGFTTGEPSTVAWVVAEVTGC
ncbi:hypothetical protein ACFU44_15165 [Nocardia rhizosphaerihabitans]|uniref:hypothetical protein n=1 Tax=Nocardia rhizosphaerihabitans TaxID=1691570 RepID=UPI00366ACF59